MDNSLQIDNVQSFVKAIGDNNNLWRLLHKKEVSRLKEEVKYKYQNFAQFFQPSQKLDIFTNYRSATSIVDIGNTLMHGLGRSQS
ncbi:hypothetical protein [Nostoc favosum]|uniref:Uncharacterized protein n=1 Tax=Nostoc favosum CHAB5714 TaxID=2780399 RepID=A0ABS8IBG6_9NOSO|nr:hypothetical protein [Nostoc favosum]MCC5601216.1 hypothetical protein [Nostoc favosum CHAB5714]